MPSQSVSPPTLPAIIAEFGATLRARGLAESTISFYLGDIGVLAGRLARRNIHLPEASLQDFLREFDRMAKKGSRPATIARYVASTRGFFRFLGEKGSIPDTTIGTLVWQSADHTHRHLPLLTKQELEAILDAPDPLTAIGARNRLILKFFARVDIGATQLAKLTLSQIDLFPDLAAETRDYVNTFRSLITLTRGDQTNILFPAVHGGRLSRHMIWRVLKNAAAMAWVNKELTAHVLRESWTKHMG